MHIFICCACSFSCVHTLLHTHQQYTCHGFPLIRNYPVNMYSMLIKIVCFHKYQSWLQMFMCCACILSFAVCAFCIIQSNKNKWNLMYLKKWSFKPEFSAKFYKYECTFSCNVHAYFYLCACIHAHTRMKKVAMSCLWKIDW